MKTKRLQQESSRLACCLLIFLCLVTITGSGLAEIIPSSRQVTWQGNVGVSGDIPTVGSLKTLPSYASYNNYSSASQSVIESCLKDTSYNGCYLPAGTYKTTGTITVPSNKVLRGAGMGQTIIKNSSDVTYLVGFANSPGYYWTAGDKTISSGATKGSTSITTSSSHGWSVGDYILIDQLEDPTGDPPVDITGGEGECTACGRTGRPVGQIVKLVAPTSGTTATLEIPLYKTYNKTPVGTKMTGITTGAGVEDLTLDSQVACANGNYGIFHMANAVSSWLLRVELIRPCRTGLQMLNTYRNTIRSIKIHEAQNHTSNGGYGLWMMSSNSANLIEDSIFYNMLVGIIYTGPVSGNVFAYNYITSMYSTDYPTAGWFGIASHGTEPWMNLFEGNIVLGNIVGGDYAWGGSAYGTYLRNKVNIKTSGLANTIINMSFAHHDYYMNVIGNVLGTSGYENNFQTSDYYDGKKSIYYIDDTGVNTSTLRHGNWDSVNNTTVWNSTISDRSLPSSLYLTSKPSWWGSSPWPAIGPDLSPMGGSIPAEQRYNGVSVLQPPVNLRLTNP
jgi:hypothetical protein